MKNSCPKTIAMDFLRDLTYKTHMDFLHSYTQKKVMEETFQWHLEWTFGPSLHKQVNNSPNRFADFLTRTVLRVKRKRAAIK